MPHVSTTTDLSTTTDRALHAAPSLHAAARRHWRRRLVVALLAALTLPVGYEAIRVFAGRNLHVVVEGKVYRGAQPTPVALRELVQRYHIKTIVNLRGCCNPMPWYLDQCRAVQELDLNQEDVCLSAGRMPPMHELRRLVEVLDGAAHPLFLHCWRGADRTGLAAAVFLLLQPDISLAEARRQLRPRYGHFALGRPAELDEFLEMYEAWLHRHGMEHSPQAFRRWARHDYQGGYHAYRIEHFAALGPLRTGEPLGFTVRFRNTGQRSWQFKPTLTAGHHAGFQLRDERGQTVTMGYGGFMDKEVPPGEAIDVTLVVPPLHAPGRYRLLVDLVERQLWLFQSGADTWEEELHIRE